MSSFLFSIFRVALGLYLCVHFLWLLDSAAELYSREGLFGRQNQDLSRGFTQLLFVGVILGSVAFTAGLYRRTVSFVLWAIWAFLLFRTPLVTIPSTGYIGYLLLLCVAVPAGEPGRLLLFRNGFRLSLRWVWTPRHDWRMPPVLILGTWLVLGLSYSASGIDKFDSPSWRNGEAMRFVMTSPIAYPSFAQNLFLKLPQLMTQIFTWFALGLEALYLVFCLWPRARLMAWVSIMAMHITILLFLDIVDVSVAMVITHFFVFDEAWLPRRLHQALVKRLHPGNPDSTPEAG